MHWLTTCNSLSLPTEKYKEADPIVNNANMKGDDNKYRKTRVDDDHIAISQEGGL